MDLTRIRIESVAGSGVWLHVEAIGDGPALVLTHGLGDSGETWDRVTSPLADRHRVTSWDLRGHERSDAPEATDAYSRDIGVADLLRVIDAAGAPVDLVGHSLGGYLSLFVALRHPELVRSLVMISAGPGFRDEAKRAEWNNSIDVAVLKMPIAPHVGGLCEQPDAWVVEQLGSLRPPLLQIVGEKDKRFIPGVDYVARSVAGSDVVRIPGAGHHPQRTHADEVAKAILAHTKA